MAGIGVGVVGLMAVSVVLWWRGALTPELFAQQGWLRWAWILSAPAGYVAIETGWIVRCVGRQPWTVYGELRTSDAASVLPPQEVLISLGTFAILYSVLFFFALWFGSRIIRRGPDLTLKPPVTPGDQDSSYVPNP
jgi:cytochrome d ubiquinol oxidase subunit I